jgi:acetyltransferase-like isoleucine patch superfamily enzyme
MAQESAVIGNNVSIGHHVIIAADVKIGDWCVIGNHITIEEGTVLGNECVISDFAHVGKRPKLSALSTAKKTELEPLQMGKGCSLGSHCVVMAGTTLGDRVIVADNAGVRERCTVGDDVVVGRGVTVENDTTIGARTKLQTGAYVTAYVTIEEDVFIAPMVVTTNDNFMGRTEERKKHIKGCTVKRGARIGGGAHILPGIIIGEDAFVATAAVVTHDVEDKTVVMGVPAKPVREVAAEELLENQ